MFSSTNNTFFTFQTKLNKRIASSILIALITTVLLWLGLLLLFQEVLLINWTPQRRADLAITIALPLGIIWAIRKFYTRIYGVSLHKGTVHIYRKIEPLIIPIEQFKVIVGVGGIDISGGKLITLKRLILIFKNKEIKLRFSPEENAEIYKNMLHQNEKLVGIPYPFTHIDRVEYFHLYLTKTISIFYRTALIKLLSSCSLLLPMMISIVILFSTGLSKSSHQASQLILFGAILGLTFLVSAIQDFIIPLYLKNMLMRQPLIKNLEIRNQECSHNNKYLKPIIFDCKKCKKDNSSGNFHEQMKSLNYNTLFLKPKSDIFITCLHCGKDNLTSLGHTELIKYSDGQKFPEHLILWEVSILGKSFVMISLLLSLIPFLGLAFCLIAYLFTRLSTGIYKKLTYFGLAVNLIITLLLVILK